MQKKSVKPFAKNSHRQKSPAGRRFDPPTYGIDYVDRQNGSVEAPVERSFESSPDPTIVAISNSENSERHASNSRPGNSGTPDTLGQFAPVQLEEDPEEEAPVQGKFVPAQGQGDPEEDELLQGKFAPAQLKEDSEEEELLQGKFESVQREVDLEEEKLLQGKFPGTGAPMQLETDVDGSKNSTGMPDQLKSGLEQLGGFDLSGVTVHYNSSKPAQLNALAYTQGKDIHVGPGQEKHLPHEGWHVVQQMQGRVKPTMQAKGESINDDAGLEREADVMGTKATQMIKRLTHKAQGYDSGVSQRVVQLVRYADPFIEGLYTKVQAGDNAGFFSDLSGTAGARAGDAAVRSAFSDFVADGHITWADAFHAAALLELGPRRDWPQLIKNYDEGLTSGTFTIAALPPIGAEPLRQFCMAQAGEAAEGSSVSASYRNRFNSLWDAPPHSALSADFDPTLDSKGPRNPRARSIFSILYSDPAVGTAYDSDTPTGFREMCDTLMGPEGVNLIASPRLQVLRALFNPPVVAATGTADAPYVALVAAVRPAAEALEGADREQIQRSHAWRLAVDAKVSGPSDVVTQTLRTDLWNVVLTSRPALAAAPAAPAVPALPEAPPALNAAAHTWLSGITLSAPPSPVNAQAAQQSLTFLVNSSVPNPGVAVRRHLVVEPAAQVISGQDDQTPWPVGSSAVPHTAAVDPDAGAAPSRVFTSRLNLPPVRSADFAEQTATVTVQDGRKDWFRNNIAMGATFMDENVSSPLAGGSTINYYGGQLSITVRPILPADNPGLPIEMEGEVKKGGMLVHTFARRTFGRTARSDQLGEHIEQEGGAPPASDPMELKVSFFGPAGPAIKVLTLAFNVAPSLPVAAGTDAAILAADTTALNQPAATAGSLLNHMASFPPSSAHHRVGNAVASGAIQVEAVIVRSDSAAWLAAHGGNPATQVAYACGNMTDARVLAAGPGAIGWRRGAFPNHVFLNLTPRIQTPATKRSNAEMAGLLAHEGIHAADRIEPGALGQYSTEFRAYWIMGMGGGLSTAPDPTMTGMGPKSPRARAIFNHLYNHPLYSRFTRPNYDQNNNHFRERVDNMLVPDGINLALSGNLQALRTEIESYTGPATFAAKRAAIGIAYLACTADEQLEISSNRAWRDLVESKFTVPANRSLIKADLVIPQ